VAGCWWGVTVRLRVLVRPILVSFRICFPGFLGILIAVSSARAVSSLCSHRPAMSLARRRKRGIIWGVVLYLPCVSNTVVEERYVPLVGGREKGLIAIGAVGEREREAVGLRPAAWKDFEDEKETVRDLL